MPKRTDQHIIDDEGTALLRSVIADNIVLINEQPDYGIDYRAQVFERTHEHQEPSGLNAFLQVKSTRHPSRRADGRTTLPFPTDHLAYYVDQLRIPVFLVLADTVNRVPYFCFLQQHALEDLSSLPWRNQSSVTISLAPDHVIDKGPGLEEAISNADAYMAALHPAGLEASIAAEQARLDSLDHRVRASLSIIDGAKHLSITALTPLSFSLVVTGESKQRRRALNDLLGRGITIRPEEYGVAVRAKDLPLHPNQETELTTLQAHLSTPGSIHMSTIGESGSHIGSLDLAGTWIGGTIEQRISAYVDSGIFGLEVTLGTPKPGGLPIGLTIKFDLSRWMNKPILHASDLGTLHRLFPLDRNTSSIRLVLYASGNELAGQHIPIEDVPAFESVESLVHVMWMAREIASQVAPQLQLSGPLTHRSLQEIRSCFDLLRGDYVPLEITSGSFATTCPLKALPTNVASGKEVRGSISLVQDKYTCTILNQTVDVGEVEVTYEGAILRADSVSEVDTESVRVEWKLESTKNARLRRSIGGPTRQALGNPKSP